MTSPTAYVVANVIVDHGAVDAMMRTLQYNMSNVGLSVFLEDVADPFVRRRVAERFTGEGDDAVGSWAPLSPATQTIRASKGFPPAHPINQRTHAMRDWLVHNDGEVRFNAAYVSLLYPGPTTSGTMDEKIRTAQMGKGNPRTPPRPVLGLNETDNLFIQAELVMFLLSGM
jgi:hypothetical protein